MWCDLFREKVSAEKEASQLSGPFVLVMTWKKRHLMLETAIKYHHRICGRVGRTSEAKQNELWGNMAVGPRGPQITGREPSSGAKGLLA